jgi:hypothetical protein
MSVAYLDEVSGYLLRLPDGVSYRQLDHWARQGWLFPTRGGIGTGHRREWSETEIRVAEMIARLRSAGLELPAAAAAARSIVYDGWAELDEGITITVRQPGKDDQ